MLWTLRWILMNRSPFLSPKSVLSLASHKSVLEAQAGRGPFHQKFVLIQTRSRGPSGTTADHLQPVLDGVGAYDLMSRKVMLEGLATDRLLPFVRHVYGSTSMYLWEGETSETLDPSWRRDNRATP